MPLIFLVLSIILSGGVTYALDYHDEYKSIFWAQESLFLLLIALYISLIVQNPYKKKGSYEKI